MVIFFFVLILFSTSVGASSVKIEGVSNAEILERIKEQILSSKSKYSEIPDSISAKYRLKKDEKIILTILHSFGYFDAEVTHNIINGVIKLNITLNERYNFNEVLLKYVDNPQYSSGLTIGEVFELVNIDFNSFATTREISAAAVKIKEFFQSKGFAFVASEQPEVEIDRKNKKIKAIFNIILNGKVVIDKTIVNIKSKKNAAKLFNFVKNRVSWNDGDFYDLEKINEMKEQLMNSGIFYNIDINLSEPKKDENDKSISHTVMTINAEEGMLRNIEAGVKYGSSDKLGLFLSWTHYNIDGCGSELSTVLDISKRNKTARVKHNLHDFINKKHSLSSQIFYTKENTLSYGVDKTGVESIVWRELSQKFRIVVGCSFEKAKTNNKITPAEKKIKFNGIGIPIGVSLDKTDSFLDPKTGFRYSGNVTPFFGDAKRLTVASGKFSFYLPVSKTTFKRPTIIAFYTKIGSIINNEKLKTPIDRLFFAGGANSIRGYGYQKLGPFSTDGLPLGGKSSFEFGVEPRLKITDDIGAVLFVECGNVYNQRFPKLFKNALFGYGAGIRYYTPLGPIRLDIAFPAKRRRKQDGSHLDSTLNIYVSIGQSF
ncbi:outer membrane protein assembly factor [Alphaproteobacteria bacterium]|nr:outer membrane protein assembly factor [Alphaproteobacteria bacterium]